MKYQKTAFSLIELVIIVAFLGIIAFIAVPRLNFALISKQKAETTARKIVTDLRRTRRLAISDAANNTVGFALYMDGPGGAGSRTFYQIRDRSTGPPSVLEQHAIDSNVTVTSDTKTIRFGPLGNILDSDTGFPSQMTVSAEGKICTIQFFIATGTIKCVEN
jgi:Tfp pilus assembly protein FimT